MNDEEVSSGRIISWLGCRINDTKQFAIVKQLACMQFLTTSQNVNPRQLKQTSKSSSMSSSTLLCILLAIIICFAKYDAAVDGDQHFIYNGFKGTNLLLGGAASITQDGILSLANNGSNSGNGFHPDRINCSFWDHTLDPPFNYFSVTFVFNIYPSSSPFDRMAFMISSTTNFSGMFPEYYFAIELEFYRNIPFCISSRPYSRVLLCASMSDYEALQLSGGKPVQLWAGFNGKSMELNVTLALILKQQEPALPLLLSYTFNMSDFNLPRLAYLLADGYAGFSASTANGVTTHQVLGWSFSLGGPAQQLNYSLLQLQQIQAPATPPSNKTMKKNLIKWLLVATVSVLTVTTIAIVLRCWYKKREETQQEDGLDYVLGPRRFFYEDLCKATNGFSSGQLLGKGGFGRVYVGALDASGTCIAVKRVSSESKQGLPQFMAEIVILGRLRHRNLVRLIGYCRHKVKGELLLVYEHMPNGSLDRYIHGGESEETLVWSQRLHVIRGVASGLLYLHEDCEKVILHRDVKASNVLLDVEMNGRLGDFGLARLHDHGHGADAQTTHVAGTRGYLAPELLRLGKATKATDVFAFGAFILEVACGRRPVGLNDHGELLVLVDWVRQVWVSGSIVDAMDPRLKDYATGEVELVLKLGLLCSHQLPTKRPRMRLIMQYLDGDLPLPEFSPDYLAITDVDQAVEINASVVTTITGLSGGR